MEVMLVRHAIAEKRSNWEKTGAPDAERPLLKEGEMKLRAELKKLKQLSGKLDLILTSPYVRARRTAEIMKETFPRCRLEDFDALSPQGSLRAVVSRLTELAESQKRVALVGHEPDLSHVVGMLLSAHVKSLVELKKGGACLVGFDGRVAAGHGRLYWLATPSMLRKQA